MANEQIEWKNGLGAEICQLTYGTLLNDMLPEYRVPWVQPIFIPGHPCFEAYCEMPKAYARLRLGVTEEDPDAEEMINHLLKHGKLLAMEMFYLGMRYQKMQAEEKPGA